MDRSVYVLLGLGTGVLPLRTARPQVAAPDASLIAEGAKVYAQNCSRCHNPRSPSERTDREWTIVVQHMQIRANLSSRRARAVRAFLQASNHGPGEVSPGELGPELHGPLDTAAVTDSTIAAGRSVFRGQGGCIACHGQQLQGGPLAPNLADARWKNGDGSLASIYTIVSQGVPGTAMVAYPGGISRAEAHAVSGYVWSVSHSHTPP